MAVEWKFAPLRPIALIILFASCTTKALVLHDQPPSSLSTPQLMGRADEVTTLEPYTGNGAAPVPTTWHLLTTSSPLHYKPTESNTTIQLRLKGNNAQIVSLPAIYNLTVFSLAEIAIATATTNGNWALPRSGQGNSTFLTSNPSSNWQFMMTASDDLPVYVVTDVLRGIQELTHYLYFLEVAFEVFSDTSPTNSPIASGCLASQCGSPIEPVQARALQYANSSSANSSTVPSRRLQSSKDPIHLVTLDNSKAVAVIYHNLKDPLPIHDQSFADVATRMLANITNLMVADHGDDLLPFSGLSKRRLLRYVDTWGSNLTISLLPTSLLGKDFTLGDAAMALKTIQDNLSNGAVLESTLEIMVGDSKFGWGCLSYARLCLMPTAGSRSSVGSGEESPFPDGRRSTDRAIESISGAANAVFDPNTVS